MCMCVCASFCARVHIPGLRSRGWGFGMHVSMSGVVCSAFCQLTETRAEGTARCRQAAMGRPQLGCLAKALAQARAKRKKEEGKGTKEGNNRTVKGQKKEEKEQEKCLRTGHFRRTERLSRKTRKAFREPKKPSPGRQLASLKGPLTRPLKVGLRKGRPPLSTEALFVYEKTLLAVLTTASLQPKFPPLFRLP